MQKYISYLRVSTVKQNNSHLGLEAQQSAIENYVRSTGGEIIETFTEIETAGSKDRISISQQVSIQSLLRKRPLLLQAINLAETTGAKIICKESSRLTRFSLLMEFLLKSSVIFVFADSPNDTPFLVKLKTSLNEEELLRISERTKSALKALKDRGFVKKERKTIGLTLDVIKKGTQRIKELAALNENNKKASGYIIMLRKSGMTFQQIADKLNEEGFQSSQNMTFKTGNVYMLYARAIQSHERK